MDGERWGSLVCTPSPVLARCRRLASCRTALQPPHLQGRHIKPWNLTLYSKGFYDSLVPFLILLPLGSQRGGRREKGEERSPSDIMCPFGQELTPGCRSIKMRLHVTIFVFPWKQGRASSARQAYGCSPSCGFLKLLLCTIYPA